MWKALVLVMWASLLASLPYLASVAPPEAPPTPSPYAASEEPGATAYNAAVFFSMLLAATVGIYLALGRRRLLRALVYVVWFMLAVGVTQFYAVVYYLAGLLPEWAAEGAVLASPLAGAAVALMLWRGRGDMALGLLGGLAGGMLASVLPHATLLVIFALLPLYDFLMVYKGLLGRIIRRERAQRAAVQPAPQPSPHEGPSSPQPGRGGDSPLFGFVVRLGRMSLGVGDFVTYTAALTYVTAGLSHRMGPAAAALLPLGLALIYLGLRLTVKVFLRRWGYGPALPFPMLLLSPLIALAASI